MTNDVRLQCLHLALLQICRAIHLFARKRSYRLRPTVAHALALVPIKEVLDPASAAASKDRSTLSRRERRVRCCAYADLSDHRWFCQATFF